MSWRWIPTITSLLLMTVASDLRTLHEKKVWRPNLPTPRKEFVYYPVEYDTCQRGKPEHLARAYKGLPNRIRESRRKMKLKMEERMEDRD